MQTAYEDEDDDGSDMLAATEQELLNGSRLLWVALVAAVLVIFTLASKNQAVFLIFLMTSILSGIAGIYRVARVLNINQLPALLSMVAMLAPLFNTILIIYFLYRAHSELKQAREHAIASLATKKARERARQRVSANSAGSQPNADGLANSQPKTSAAGANNAANARARISRALAYVKGSDIPDTKEGQQLLARVSMPNIDMSDEDQAVVRTSKGVFLTFYMVDEGKYFSFIKLGELREAGITIEDLHTIGLRNLGALVNGNNPGLSLRPQTDFYGLLMGGNFEASLLLLDDLWENSLQKYAPNGFVITVPARDICAFCDAGSKNGIEELKRIAETVTQNGDHLISNKLFMRTQNKWAVFSDEKRGQHGAT